ncbi:hypothetical protein AXG93_2891s1200 [Marchantia polymorpha subsp. ruderalis]|uniref:Uncharacterized protein n=1 Tax=Marchantia polymorpha subsp. ruderalis TaxID=1480154 RepID=A0A176WPD2_MARPO|nr:hypothetical protein AXG93_2891s1200 [Marchantia polymorpha subsp. ruderalis]
MKKNQASSGRRKTLPAKDDIREEPTVRISQPTAAEGAAAATADANSPYPPNVTIASLTYVVTDFRHLSSAWFGPNYPPKPSPDELKRQKALPFSDVELGSIQVVNGKALGSCRRLPITVESLNQNRAEEMSSVSTA